MDDLSDTVAHKSPSSRAPDARVVKSAQALRSGLLALLDRKPFDQITVRDITAEAGVHYATFFRHHPTKEALFEHLATEEIDRLVALAVPQLDAVDSRAGFTALCDYVDAHRTLWTALITGGAAGAMRAELLRISRALAVHRAPREAWLPVELAVSCAVSLIFETLAWWLAQPRAAHSNAEVAVILDRLVLATTMDPDAGLRVSTSSP